jgi:hypothetical protein
MALSCPTSFAVLNVRSAIISRNARFYTECAEKLSLCHVLSFGSIHVPCIHKEKQAESRLVFFLQCQSNS